MGALLVKVLASIGKAILFGLLSERVAVKLVFWTIENVSARTTNQWDDGVVAFLKEAYQEGSGRAVEAMYSSDLATVRYAPPRAAESDYGAAIGYETAMANMEVLKEANHGQEEGRR